MQWAVSGFILWKVLENTCGEELTDVSASDSVKADHQDEKEADLVYISGAHRRLFDSHPQ